MNRTNLCLTVALICASSQMLGCQKATVAAKKIEPAKVEPIDGSAFRRITLSEKAMERLAVQTAPVYEAEASRAENKALRPTVPYGSVMYGTNGETYVYTSPAPRTFVRQPVTVDYIEGNLAVLSAGPATGTEVVTVGASELLGTEFGVGH